jgi:hypothetical protein
MVLQASLYQSWRSKPGYEKRMLDASENDCKRTGDHIRSDASNWHSFLLLQQEIAYNIDEY